MKPRILTRKAFTVIGTLYRGNPQKGELPTLWQAFGRREHEISGLANDRVAYGLCANADQLTGEFDYLATMEVEARQEPPEGMVAWNLPGGAFAALECTLATIRQTFDAAYGLWLPQSGYVRGEGADIEVYEEFDGTDPEATFDIYIPIVGR